MQKIILTATVCKEPEITPTEKQGQNKVSFQVFDTEKRKNPTTSQTEEIKQYYYCEMYRQSDNVQDLLELKLNTRVYIEGPARHYAYLKRTSAGQEPKAESAISIWVKTIEVIGNQDQQQLTADLKNLLAHIKASTPAAAAAVPTNEAPPAGFGGGNEASIGDGDEIVFEGENKSDQP